MSINKIHECKIRIIYLVLRPVQKPLKILVVRFSSIGDIVLTTPVVRVLKKQINAEVHFLSFSKYSNLLLDNPYIDKVYTIDENINEIIPALIKEKFDLLIDLHHNIRTQLLKQKLGIPSKSFRKLNVQKWLMTTFKINLLPKIHIVDRYLETIKHLGITNDNLGLDFFLMDKDKVENLPIDYIVFAIGGKHKTKILPTEKIISICNKLNKQAILIGGKEDFERGEKIVSATSNIQNACGKYSVRQSAFIIKNAKYVITHDTGMMHIAAALKKKIYSVWGNTIPAFGMSPYLVNPNSKIIEVENLSCRPCTKIGFEKCPKGHFDCMQKIDENLFLSK